MKHLSFLLLAALAGGSLNATAYAQTEGQAPDNKDTLALEQGFADPPDSAKPWAYWFWMNGNISKEGITKDLEEMKRVGVGGALFMEITGGIDPGPVEFMSDEWRRLMKHAITEADRLGLQLNLNNDGGWCGSGGPWVTPEHAMQHVTWSEKTVRGPTRFSEALPKPFTRLDYYRDIAVLAFPTPRDDGTRMADCAFKATSSDPKFDAAKAVDGDVGTFAAYPLPKVYKTQFIQLEFAEPFTARSLTMVTAQGRGSHKGELLVSEDGKSFRAVRSFQFPGSKSAPSNLTMRFDPATARYFRIAFTAPDKSARQLAIAEIELTGGCRTEQLAGKASYTRSFSQTADDESPIDPALTIPPNGVVNLTDRMDASGRLTWEAPAGQWTILRVGHTPTGIPNHPSPKGGLGPECDKLSREALDAHFEGMMGKLIADVGPLAGKSLAYTHVDSWEVGAQNWTPKFREEFTARRGYDLLPWLPAMTGRVIDSPEATERFLWDIRRTVGDLVADNYFGHWRDLAHKHGMQFSAEAYGHAPMNNLAAGTRADMPMGEFWDRDASDCGYVDTVFRGKMASSEAHITGRQFVGAEAFTTNAENAAWRQHPYVLKALGDSVFCQGVNRLIFHRYAMQPWVDRKPPGMTMGRWGINFEWTQTWWNQSPAWLRYLARCQWLLQQGSFVADLAYFVGEESPNELAAPDRLEPPPPVGHDYDGVTDEIILNAMDCRDGRLVLSSGMSYRALVLPKTDRMTPPLLRKVADLIRKGATVIGPRPVKSPSLSDHPKCDEEVKTLASQVWGACDGEKVFENAYGQGRVVWGKPLTEVLASLNVPPDFECQGAKVGETIRYIHRQAGGADVYFVATNVQRPSDVICAFRVQDKAPELWKPDTGEIEMAAIYEEVNGHTRLPLHFDPSGSLFVVFRSEAAEDPFVSISRDGESLYPVTMAAAQPSPPPLAPDNNCGVVDSFTMAAWVRPDRDIRLLKESGGTGAQAGQNCIVYPAPGHEVYGPDDAGAGISAGRNGVCVLEHSARYFAPRLVYETPLADWTHVAVVYENKKPRLYVNGRLVREGLASAKTVHPSTGVKHTRKVIPFTGEVEDLRQFERPLTEKEVADLASKRLGAVRGGDGLAPEWIRRANGAVEARLWRAGAYEATTQSGKTARIRLTDLPKPLEIGGPWELRFPPNWGAPESVSLPKLISWTEHAEAGVKHFSGTAAYLKELDVPAAWLGAGKETHLDLGAVKVFAEVRLNGKDLGILWKPPFRVDITNVVKPGWNQLEVRVTNLWPNRMIGDESLPPDKRFTWTPLKFFDKSSPLAESGLLGPVHLIPSRRLEVKL